MRMDPGGREQVFMPGREIEGRLTLGDGRSRNDDPGYSVLVCARDDLGNVFAKRSVRQVGADVDELHRRSITSRSGLDGELAGEAADVAQRALVARGPGLADAQANTVAVALRRREHRAGRDGDAALEEPLEERDRIA